MKRFIKLLKADVLDIFAVFLEFTLSTTIYRQIRNKYVYINAVPSILDGCINKKDMIDAIIANKKFFKAKYEDGTVRNIKLKDLR